MPPTPSSASENDLDFGPTLRGLRAGLKVFERYTLVRQLGRGGMGVVWLGRDDKLDLDIALKFLPEHLVGDQSSLADLRHETRRCMKLHHTNIVHVYDLIDDDNSAAIAMEFVNGKPLSTLRAEKSSRVMDASEVLPILRQLCEALTYAHESAKIVHHDLKPANLMLTEEGVLKVMDFGIASSLNDSMSRHSRAAQAASTGGTLPYMSPQQLTGFPPSVSDDVYSLGAALYELLTSKPPFFRGEILHQVQNIVPPSMTARRQELGIEGALEIPTVWEETMAACLEKDPVKRPASAQEVFSRLTGAPSPKPVAEPAAPPTSKKPATPAAAAVSPPAAEAIPPKPARVPAAVLRHKKAILITLGAILAVGGAVDYWFREIAPRRAEALRLEQERVAEELEAAEREARLAREKIESDKKRREAENAARLAKVKADLREADRMKAAEAERKRLAALEEERKQKQQSMMAALNAATMRSPVSNSLGMKFVPAGTPGVLFSVWETRVQDFEAFVKATRHDAVKDSRFGAPAFTLAKSKDGKSAEWVQAEGSWLDPRFPTKQSGDDPVVCVSYLDAVAFCEWLGQQDRAAGKIPASASYRLPTDVEWSRACGGSTYPWGEHFPPSLRDGNFSGKEAMVGDFAGFINELVLAGYEDRDARTNTVGMYRENEFGLHDMGGNVCEWCSSWYDKSMNNPEALKTFPILEDDGGGATFRVLRGSSWYGGRRILLRSEYRDLASPRYRSDVTGFRVVLSVSSF